MIQSTPGQISMDFSVPLSKSHSAFCCCVCLQAKGHLRLLPPSDCLLAPNINGLFYQLSGNSLSTHTNRKAVFLPPFAYKHLKFLSKLEIFFFFSFGFLFNVNLWAVWTDTASPAMNQQTLLRVYTQKN